MYTITINHKNVGKTTYSVYREKEAKDEGISYKHWHEAEAGEYAISDDGYVSLVISKKPCDKKKNDSIYYRFPWGSAFHNPRYPRKTLKVAGRKTNTTLSGKSYIETQKNSQVMQDLAMSAAWFKHPDTIVDEVLGKDCEPWKRKKWKRTMKSEVFKKMKREELSKRLSDHNMTEDFTLDLFDTTIIMAKEKKDVTNLMRAVENLQDMHGMKEKHLEKTTHKIEAHSSTQLLDDILDEEKKIEITQETTKEVDE
tara:strand:- start:254 stop:1015 length:762 start_codon:yes stop_codon:yes gene_type:complete